MFSCFWFAERVYQDGCWIVSNAFAISVERVNSDMSRYRFPSVQSTFWSQSQCWEEYLGCCPNSRSGAVCAQERLRLPELRSLLGSRGHGCCPSSPGTGEDRAWRGRYNHLPRPCREEGPSPGRGQFPGSLGDGRACQPGRADPRGLMWVAACPIGALQEVHAGTGPASPELHL